jgi:hypothetical protein
MPTITDTITTTETITAAHTIVVDLPSGNVAHVVFTITAGEIIMVGALLSLLLVVLFLVVRSYADKGGIA